MSRNRLTGLGGLLLLITAMPLVGCSSNLKDENALLMEENHDLRAQLDERNVALETANDELRSQENELAELRSSVDSAAWNARSAASASVDPFPGIPGVTGSVSAGEVTASVESDVLFASGQATLRTSAKRSLDAVADILKSNYGGRQIRVAGHTDTDPIRKSGFKSNYHLGFERAYAVREYLISRGVPAERVYVASHGPDQAMNSKKESRRVDIAVVLNET